MTNAQLLKFASDKLKSHPSQSTHDLDVIERLESLANKYSDYEELASIFKQAQESLEDAKDRLVEP